MLAVWRASAMSATRLRTRGVSAPSGSPIQNAARFPRRIRPGPTTSAPKFTNAPTTRSRPTARAITSSLKPFWSETTNPSGVSRGATCATAPAVWWAFTASRTAPRPSGSASGVTAVAATVSCSTGPSMRRPSELIAATCSASASQRSTS